MQRLVVKLTRGTDDPERANQAFTVAATGLASGAEVSVWLTGDASWLAVPGYADKINLEHAMPFPELLEAVIRGGTLTVCSQCAARRSLADTDVLDGVRIAGSALFVEEIMERNTQALVY